MTKIQDPAPVTKRGIFEEPRPPEQILWINVVWICFLVLVLAMLMSIVTWAKYFRHRTLILLVVVEWQVMNLPLAILVQAARGRCSPGRRRWRARRPAAARRRAAT